MASAEVAFYILPDDTQAARLQFACSLIEKAHEEKENVYIHAPNEAIAHEIDEKLWAYRDNSFIPHGLVNEKISPPPPIQIGFELKPSGRHTLLINLCDEIPDFFQHFRRITEIIIANDNQRELARARFKQYRANACALTTHKL